MSEFDNNDDGENGEVFISCQTCDYSEANHYNPSSENYCNAFEETIDQLTKTACHWWTPIGEGSLDDIPEDEEPQWMGPVKLVKCCNNCYIGERFTYRNAPGEMYCCVLGIVVTDIDGFSCVDWQWRSYKEKECRLDQHCCRTCDHLACDGDRQTCRMWERHIECPQDTYCEQWKLKDDQPRRDITK